MNTRWMLPSLLLISLTGSTVAQAPQTPSSNSKTAVKHPVKTGVRSPASVAAAQKQLDAYLLEFQSKPDDGTLRSKVVALAKTMTPAPTIPQVALDTFSQGTAQLKVAATANDFKAAAKLFEQAAIQAPWYAEANYYAGVAYARASDYDDLKRNLEYFQAAVLPGADLGKSEELRRDLDRQQFDQQLTLAMQKFTADPSDAARTEIIKMVQGAKYQPDPSEEAHGHYVTAVALMNAAEDNTGYEQRAIEEFNKALLAAPWWAEAYKRLAAAQTAAGQFDGAGVSLNYYLLTQPTDARAVQDEIYRLKVLEMKAADEQVKRQADDSRRKQLSELREQTQSAVNSGNLTFEGSWYDASTPKQYFVGGESEPGCDYTIKKSSGHWSIVNHCPHLKRSIDRVDVQAGQLRFRLTGHDPAFPYSEVDVTFTLSPDGQKLDGRGTYYDQENFAAGYYSILWVRRK